MLKYIIRRLLAAIPVFWIVHLFSFVLMRFAPGGPFDSEKSIPEEVKIKLLEHYHLTDPLWKQYLNDLVHLLHFDFGPCFKYPGRTVNEIIAESFPQSFELGLYAFCLAVVIGILAGIYSALNKNTWKDYTIMGIAMTGICAPSFLLGPLLVLVFAILLPIFHTSGWDSWQDRILPVVTLAASFVAFTSRIMRGSMLEVLSQDYIRTARAKGLKESVVLFKHGFRGALSAVISFLGIAFAGIITGSLVVESVFDIPGMGRFFVQAAFNRDYTLIMGIVLFDAFLFITMNLVVDILLVLFDPRLSFKKG